MWLLLLLAAPTAVLGALTGYPQQDVTPAPKQAWIDAYNVAKNAGKIPSFAPSVLVNGTPTYPAGTNPCSWTNTHCFGAYDVVDAPAGIVGLSFDDGPELASPTLYNYLNSVNQHATHFVIGSRVVDYPDQFGLAVSLGEHIAVHTWSHPYMTSKTDMQVLGELGWTMQVILNQSGLVPSFWRPPYGDIDNRVRAIAKEVFGLYSVLWNQDTFDWCLKEGGGSSCVGFGPLTDAGLDAELQKFYTGPKSPGLIILEHELTSRSVGGFMRNFPSLLSNGWTPKPIPDIWSVPWYQNALNNGAPKTAGVDIVSGPGMQNVTTNNSTLPSNTATVTTPTASVVKIVTPTSIDAAVTAASTVIVTAYATASAPPTVVVVTATSPSPSASAVALPSSTRTTTATAAPVVQTPTSAAVHLSTGASVFAAFACALLSL